FGAVDLDLAPARNGRQFVGNGGGGSIWCDQDSSIDAWMAVDFPDTATMNIVVRNDTDGVLGEFPVRSNTDFLNVFRGKSAPRKGWISLLLDSIGLPEPDGVPYALKVQYLGTSGL